MSSNSADLDLTKTQTDDLSGLASKIENYFKLDNAQKTALAYNWEKNHLMLDGQQWLVYEGDRQTGGLWKRLDPNPQNQYIPRPVTNYLFDVFQTLKGYLLKNKPRSTVRPNTQTAKDKTAAKLAELVLDCNYERLHEAENYEYAASVLVCYGTVLKKSFWDSSYLSLAKVPKMIQRPVTDPQTGMPTGQLEEVQAVDPMTNEPLFDEIPLGDLQTAVIEPYRFAMDPMAIGMHDPRWVMEFSIRPLTWIVENYDKQLPGYTGLAKEVQPEKSLPASMRRFFQLKTSSGVKGMLNNGLGAFASAGDTSMIDEAAIVKEYYERPTQQNPKGRLVVVANGKTIYAGPSPCEGPEQGDWHPYSECRWEIMPGRFPGKGPFDDATELQKQINSIDSITILTRKTMAVPQKLVPRQSIVPGNKWTGQPGQEIPYTPGPNGEKPETIQPAHVHEGVFQEREQKVNDMKQITGAVDILKGDRPPGVTAYSALSLLFEVGTGKLFPVLDRWKRFKECDSKKQLRVIAKKYREPRPDFIRILMSRNSELTEEQVKSFIGEDLYDNCNVIIEASSSIPQLKAAEQAKLLELAQLGVLNLQNPANRNEFLDRFGIKGFDTDYSKDAKRAEDENENMDNLINDPQNKPVVLPMVDNHQIHIAVHTDRMKEPAYLSMPPEVQQMYMQHVAQHQQLLDQQQQQQQMMAMMSGQPPQQAPNPMEAQQKVGKGKGVSPQVQKSMMQDVLGPYAGSLKGA